MGVLCEREEPFRSAVPFVVFMFAPKANVITPVLGAAVVVGMCGVFLLASLDFRTYFVYSDALARPTCGNWRLTS